MTQTKEMSAAEYRERINAARKKEHEAELKESHFHKARNLWRRIVKKRIRQAKEAAERRKKHDKPHVVGKNRVQGGEPEARLLYLMELAHKEFRLFYQEAGGWVQGYGITNVPSDQDRSDCSWWFTMIYFCCGLKGPAITGGFTGTILTEGREVDRHYAETHVGVAVVFGSGDGFHVAASKGNGTSETYGHGRPEVDVSDFDAFGPGTEVRYRAFL